MEIIQFKHSARPVRQDSHGPARKETSRYSASRTMANLALGMLAGQAIWMLAAALF